MQNYQKNSIIPRELLFGNKEKSHAKISPDGNFISWLAPKNDILTIWIAPRNKLEDAYVLIEKTSQSIHRYQWSRNSNYLLYMQDTDGDENWQVHAVNIKTQKDLNLTNSEGVNADIVKMSWHHPDYILVAMNNRDPHWHDIYKVNIINGEKELLLLNDKKYASVDFDEQYEVKLAEKVLEEDNTRILYRYRDNKWDEFKRIKHNDSMNTYISHVDAVGIYVYILDSSNHDTNALLQVDIEDGTQTELAHFSKSDISDLLIHPVSYKVEAWASNYLKRKWHILSCDIQEDFDVLTMKFSDTFRVVSRTKDDIYWIIAVSDAQKPEEVWLYSRAEKSFSKLYDSRPKLDSALLLKMYAFTIKSRDSLELVSYLTLPKNISLDIQMKASEAVPMVLLVHGGPWWRDTYGYNPSHQWLANRGYAVLSVNFRASTGFGKGFVNKGDKEWSGKMHDDLIDATNWAISKGIAKKNKIAIMGHSYGGYAALVGLTYTPEVFCCGISLVGISNLETLLKTIPPYWKSDLNDMIERIGNPFTSEGRKHLASCSPLYKANEITKPLLIGQGANDVRVKQAEAEQMIHAMKENNLPVTYALYPNEGHNWRNSENELSFNALAENFLALYLGGQVEPIHDTFKKSSIEIKEGKDVLKFFS